MRIRMGGLAGAAALAGAAVLAPAQGAVSSATETTWTVRPGGAIMATAGKTTLKDTTTDLIETCRSSRMSGTLKGGSGLPGTGIGSISAAAYDCTIPVGTIKLTPRGLPWHLNVVSYDAATGVSRGTITHLELALSSSACSAMVNGTSGPAADGMVAVSYANKTGKLNIHPAGGNLHWVHVSGCAGLVGNGHPATISAAYALSPQQTISSP
jgi:hypothetical protein